MNDDILLDPLTLEQITEAVVSKNCGHSFSNDSIKEWLQKKEVCPICNTTMTVKDLTPNYTLRDIIKHIEKLKLQPQEPDESSLNNDIKENINNSQLQQQTEQQQQEQPKQHVEQKEQLNQQEIKIKKKQCYIIRELCTEDINDAAILLEKSTREDIFMNFFFHDSPNYRISGGTWFCNKMITYALNKARCIGCFELEDQETGEIYKKPIISGILISQPPHDCNGVSISEMFKVGMYMAPLKLGLSVLTRILKSSDFAEKIHQSEMRNRGKHWYLNAIAVEHSFRRSQRGSDLIKYILNFADSQNALVYTECDLQHTNFFRAHGFNMSKFYQQHSNTHDAPHFYTMIRELKSDQFKNQK